ncbi:uncharacterized protein LACBIDRAFT_333509 [Laccaria bicolor S238N-H82]|uniref:Predicted protein n=1 Tax=Laccaria bicolor (strain S238N-H82 / ATCC MYA-4686) TaxID=486041 RepID=B0DW51_LACBS|nr:uncharacterized protein LACBIDRAFT_333509 [Laccaria bicolor S238N-H82]EDR01171.1 predicted protein [Laccaria bicolor S238N-H82]|eukprot:XP_001888213.1 predicted protein [Laccaria bicolor S238N-H82]
MNDTHSLQSRVNTNYLPLVETDIEKSGDPSPTCLRFLDGRDFNVNSRRPQYQEVDGTVSQMTSYAPLQSDIATAVSLAATVTRVAAMERGGISPKGLSQAISSWPPSPRHFTRKSDVVVIYLTLFATFSIDYFSAALTGSIVWETGDRLIPGTVPLTNITRGIGGKDISGYFLYTFSQDWVMAAGTASANVAWGALQSNTNSDMTEPATRYRRVMKGAQYLSTNSTLANVTMPYFALDAFEWVPEPLKVLTKQQMLLFSDYNQSSPYFSFLGIGGPLPDRAPWGPPHTPVLGEPHTVSETRLLSFRNYTIDPGSQVKLLSVSFRALDNYTDCFAIANITYRAGATMCHNCKLISPTVLEAQPPFSLIGDSLTSMALGLAPALGTNLFFSNYSIPLNYGTRKNLAIEMTSRGYQAAWAAFADVYAPEWDNTTVKIALPTLRATIIRWRVDLWVLLHLYTRAVFTKSDGRLVSDPWQPGTEIRDDGMLILELDEAGQRSVQVKRESGLLRHKFDSLPVQHRTPWTP